MAVTLERGNEKEFFTRITAMFQAIEAEIDSNGHLFLKEKIHLSGRARALVIIMDSLENQKETALLSEMALAQDWNRMEEEDAWERFQ